MVKADGSRSRGRGFKPRHRILDGCKQCLAITYKKVTKIKIAKWGTPKKKKKKKKKCGIIYYNKFYFIVIVRINNS